MQTAHHREVPRIAGGDASRAKSFKHPSVGYDRPANSYGASNPDRTRCSSDTVPTPAYSTDVPALVTAAYLVYLVCRSRSAGRLVWRWLNTLLPTRSTTHWYVDRRTRASAARLQRSLAVVAITCAACLAIGLPLAYALFHRKPPPALR